MEANSKKTVLIAGAVIGVVVLLIVGAVLGGWFNAEKTETLVITGSTTVLPVVQNAAEVFMEKHKNIQVSVSGGGSSVGIRGVSEGTADIGMSSRDLTSNEINSTPTLKTTTIAKDCIVIIVHPSNPVGNLTIEQVRGIYNGTYKNWQELGGENKEIVVINRDSNSGTREFFWEHVMKKENFTTTALEKNSNGAVKQTVAQTPGAIGYVGLGYIDTSVKAIKINQNNAIIEPSVTNVLNGKYPIARNLYLVTNGVPKGNAKLFIDFMLSAEGQKIVEKEGFIPISAKQ